MESHQEHTAVFILSQQNPCQFDLRAKLTKTSGWRRMSTGFLSDECLLNALYLQRHNCWDRLDVHTARAVYSLFVRHGLVVGGVPYAHFFSILFFTVMTACRERPDIKTGSEMYICIMLPRLVC